MKKRFAFLAVVAIAATVFVASPALAKHPPGYEKQATLKHDAAAFEITTMKYEALAVYAETNPVLVTADVAVPDADATVTSVALTRPTGWISLRYGDYPEQRPSNYITLRDQPPYCSHENSSKKYSDLGNSKAYMRERK